MSEFHRLIKILCDSDTDVLIRKHPLGIPRGREVAEVLRKFWLTPSDSSTIIFEVSDYFVTCHNQTWSKNPEYRSIQAFVLLLLVNHYEQHGNSDDVSWPINYTLIGLHRICCLSGNNDAFIFLRTWYVKLVRFLISSDWQEQQDLPIFKAAELLAVANQRPYDEMEILTVCTDFLALRAKILRKYYADATDSFVIVPNGYNHYDDDWREAFNGIRLGHVLNMETQ